MTRPINNTLITAISKIIGEILKGSEITRMFQIIDLPDFDLISRRPATSTKWRRIDESISDRCSKNNSARPLFEVIEYVMSPQNFINQATAWSSTKKEINAQLMFYGYELNDSGKVIVAKTVQSFSEAQKRLQTFNDKLSLYEIHPQIFKYCREELFVDDYYHAVFESSKGILDKVRELSEFNDDGNTLIDNAFRNKCPTVVIRNNMLKTQTEISEYNGLKSLLKTIVYFYRNPLAHELRLYNPKSETDAVTAFCMMSLAFKILDNCVNVRSL